MKKTLIMASMLANVVFIILWATNFSPLRPNQRTADIKADIKIESVENGFAMKTTMDGNRPYYIVNRGGKMTFDFRIDQKDAFIAPRLFAMPDLTMNIVVPVKPLSEKAEIQVKSPTEVLYVSELFPKEYFSERFLGRVEQTSNENQPNRNGTAGSGLPALPPEAMVRGLVEHLFSDDLRLREKALSLLKQIDSPEANKAVEEYEQNISNTRGGT